MKSWKLSQKRYNFHKIRLNIYNRTFKGLFIFSFAKTKYIKMKLKRIYVLLLLFGVQAYSFAQQKVDLPQTSIKAAYMGSIVYPGFKIGIERPFSVKQIDKRKYWGVKTILKEKFLTLNVGFYHHPTFHDNLYVLAEFEKRRQQPKGIFLDFSTGLGYSQTFLDGTIYKVDDLGKVTSSTSGGYGYGMFSIGTGIGYDFSQKDDTNPLKIYLKPSILVMAPYNNFVYLRPTLEIGAIYPLQSFLKATSNFKFKQK